VANSVRKRNKVLPNFTSKFHVLWNTCLILQMTIFF